jgi:hypothetical protein
MVVQTSPSQFYLSRVADELVVKTGKNPIWNFAAKKHILVIGGGVTGLTVSDMMCAGRRALMVNSLTDCMGSLGRWISGHHPVREVGVSRNPYYLPNCRRIVRPSFRFFDLGEILSITSPTDGNGHLRFAESTPMPFLCTIPSDGVWYPIAHSTNCRRFYPQANFLSTVLQCGWPTFSSIGRWRICPMNL